MTIIHLPEAINNKPMENYPINNMENGPMTNPGAIGIDLTQDQKPFSLTLHSSRQGESPLVHWQLVA